MNYKFTIFTTSHFIVWLKQVTKKYPGFKTDIEKLKISLLQNAVQVTTPGKNCYKIRIKISGKPSGKSGGARVITFVKLPHLKIVLLDLYDKADKDTVSTNELLILLKKENFNV